jgi:hypothetical protein
VLTKNNFTELAIHGQEFIQQNPFTIRRARMNEREKHAKATSTDARSRLAGINISKVYRNE